MEYKIVYPRKHSKRKREYTIRIVTLCILALGFITCGIINLCCKGSLWSLYVLVAEWVFWVVFVERPLLENSIVIKFQKIIIATGVLLLATLVILKETSISTSIPIVLSSGQIFLGLLLLFSYHRRNKDSFKLTYIFSEIFILAGCLSSTILFKSWYLYLLFGIAALLMCINIILYRKEMRLEFKKRFNVKKE